MKRLTYSAYLIILMVVLFSCQKEFSRETGAIPITDTLKNNCRLQQLVEKNIASGRAEYAYISTYNASNVVSRIVFFDSLNNVTDNSFSINYPVNKVQLDATQYFLTSSDGKVIEFHGFEDPADPTGDRIMARYSYNASNQLIQRTQEYDSVPGRVIFGVDYTYTANNLTKAVISVFNGTAFVPGAEVVYEYDASKTVKGFLFMNAFAPEITYFQTAANFGVNSINTIKKTTFKYRHITTGAQVTETSNFVNFIFDTNNYVKSFELTGDNFNAGGLYAGYRYVLNYFCF